MTRDIGLLINGSWVDGRAGQPEALISPVDGKEIARVHQADDAQLDSAVEAAWGAQRELATLTAFDRAALANAVADLMEERAETIARDLSAENGKPMQAEAVPEVAAAVEMFRDAAEAAKRLETSVIPSSDRQKRVLTLREARGVYGILTPWNFPATIPSEYLSAGLATGNGMVWKPSELTPMTAAHIAKCFVDAGVPNGALNLLHGDPSGIGGGIASHTGVTAVGLTGSSRTGQIVAELAAGKPLLLELGGNCPVVVFDDVDVEAVAEKLAFGCFANAGQICDSVERILCHGAVYEDLIEAVTAAAGKVELGDPFQRATTMGPLISEPGAARVDDHLEDAVSLGAEVVTGGRRGTDHPTDLYYEPTVLKGLASGMRMEREETFGPVAAFGVFDDEADALEKANDSPTGLVGSVFTKDIGRAMRVAEKLRTGVVNINETTAYWQPHTPFGGFSGTQSGIGRLGGRWTLMEMTQLKTINIDIG